MTGAELIAAERARQQSVEGYSAEHDREHGTSELACAAICYAAAAAAWPSVATSLYAHLWPRSWQFKEAGAERMLVKAGALIAAEIDRLQAERRAITRALLGEGDDGR